jgi:putative two-component system response regulator
MEKKINSEKLVILGVDDNPVNLRSMKVFLEHKFEIIPVKSGLEGLRVLKMRKVDLILLDIEMPVMSGFDFMTEMKTIPLKADIPIICVTGHDATPKFISSVIHAGAKDFVTKPFEPDVLVHKVSKVLGVSEFVL